MLRQGMKRKERNEHSGDEALRRQLVQLQRQALVANAATQLQLYRQMQAIRQRLGK